jgi:hypothetical protein
MKHHNIYSSAMIDGIWGDVDFNCYCMTQEVRRDKKYSK